MSCRGLINQGNTLYDSGKLEEAYNKLEETLRLCPNDPRLAVVGKVELMTGLYDKAVNMLRQ